MGRNTPILQEIITALSTDLDDSAYALDQLEAHFHDRLLVDVGNVATISSHATQLRLNITQAECSRVLDYVAAQNMVLVTEDQVEQVVWDLFGNRFTEP